MQELFNANEVIETEINTTPAEKRETPAALPDSAKRFSSITHLHLYAVINTIIQHRFTITRKSTLRILDVGCGNGIMLSTLVKELPIRHPHINFEFFGIDVYDSQIQPRGYFRKTITLLEGTDPETRWSERLRLLKSTQQWPFPKDFFDLIVSNQVMEHVFNQPFFLSEIKRTMKISGYSFHLYPLQHYVYEGHLLIPFVHKFTSWTGSYHWIRLASYLGIGTYRIHKKKGIVSSVHQYARMHADYLAYQVNYKTESEITKMAKESRLKNSFDFTHLYYKQKLRSLFRLPPIEVYSEKDFTSVKNNFYFSVLKYVGCITLMLRKGKND